MAGKIQGADMKTEAELIAAGATKTSLTKDSQIYVEANAINKTLDDAIIDGDIGGGGGSGFNFLSAPNSKFASSVGDWVTFDDGAVATPVDGTGGAPTVITVARVTTFDASGGLQISHSAANGQGEGASVAFTVGPKHRGVACSITGTYQTSSPYVDDNLEAWIYDVTNSVLIQPAPFKLKASTVPSKFKFEFQTSATGASYRLLFFCPNTTATAYTVDIDDISVGPTIYNYGLVGTDWKAYTPTLTGFGTATDVSFYYRRLGDSIEIQGHFISGTSTATQARVSLPSGLITGTTVHPNNHWGQWIRQVAAGTTEKGGALIPVTSQNYFVFGSISTFGSGSTALSLTAGNGNDVAATGNLVSISMRVPVAGYSSNVQLSDDADLRIVQASYYLSGNFVTTASIPVNYDTKITDTHNAVTTSPTAWKFTAPVSGYYMIILPSYDATTTIHDFGALYKNGSIHVGAVAKTNGATSGNGYGQGGGTIVQLNAGDFIDIRGNTTIRGGAATGGNTARIDIVKVNGPSAISASETISATYGITTGASTTSANPINFETKVHDSHNAVTTGVGTWKFTAPSSGYYHVSGVFLTTAATANLRLFVNGTGQVYLGTMNTALNAIAGVTVKLNAGDFIQIFPDATITPASIASGLYQCLVSIDKKGL